MKGQKTGGKNWKKGQSGNPKGTPGLTKDVRDARKLTTQIFNQLGSDLLYSKADNLTAIMQDDDKPMIEKIVANIILRSAMEADQMRVGFLLDRILGKPKINEEQPQIRPVIITTMGGTRIECGMADQTGDDD